MLLKNPSNTAMLLNSFTIVYLGVMSQALAANNPTCTTQYGSTSESPVPTSTKTLHFTTTLTESVVQVTKTITSGTSTVPTPNGFTPILSETTSVSPGFPSCLPSNNAAVSAHGHPPSCYPAFVICTTSSTLSVTKTATKGHAVTTVTSTTTTIVPAATFYAACGADNIVDQGQGAGYGHAIEFETFGCGAGNYNMTEIVNSTAYDCCVACQTTDLCAFSSLSTYYGENPPVEPNCFLSIPHNGLCDGGMSSGPAEYYYDPGSSAGPGQGFIVSNGACGQVVWGGSP